MLKAVREQDNASDKFLRVVETVDLPAVLARLPRCRHICTTGGKATEVLLSLLPDAPKMPKTGETLPFTLANRHLTLTPSAFHLAGVSAEFAEKGSGISSVFEMAGLV